MHLLRKKNFFIKVFVKKELIKVKISRQSCIKLLFLLSKIYTVAEKLNDMKSESRNNNLNNNKNQTSNKISIQKESYILRKHANVYLVCQPAFLSSSDSSSRRQSNV